MNKSDNGIEGMNYLYNVPVVINSSNEPGRARRGLRRDVFILMVA
jgi:hypothetical protein